MAFSFSEGSNSLRKYKSKVRSDSQTNVCMLLMGTCWGSDSLPAFFHLHGGSCFGTFGWSCSVSILNFQKCTRFKILNFWTPLVLVARGSPPWEPLQFHGTQESKPMEMEQENQNGFLPFDLTWAVISPEKSSPWRSFSYLKSKAPRGPESRSSRGRHGGGTKQVFVSCDLAASRLEKQGLLWYPFALRRIFHWVTLFACATLFAHSGRYLHQFLHKNVCFLCWRICSVRNLQ